MRRPRYGFYSLPDEDGSSEFAFVQQESRQQDLRQVIHQSACVLTCPDAEKVQKGCVAGSA